MVYNGSCVAGLNDIDVEGEWLVQRQVIWPILPRLMNKAGPQQRKGSWDLNPDPLTTEREEVTLSFMCVNLSCPNRFIYSHLRNVLLRLCLEIVLLALNIRSKFP